MTTIWPRVRSRTNDRFWRASREACPTDRQSTPKAICGIAVSLAAASFESRQMGKLIAWLRAGEQHHHLHVWRTRSEDALRHDRVDPGAAVGPSSGQPL